MSTWNCDQDGQQREPVEPPARNAEPGNTGPFVTEGSLAVAADATPSPAAPSPVAVFAAPPAESPTTTSDAPGSDAEDIEQNKVFAILAYLGILFLVPLLAAPNSRFARYHANQGIVLFLATVVVTGVFYILGHIPVLGRVIGFVGYFVWLVAFVLMVLGIVNAANGKCQPLPVLGGVQLLK